VAEKKDLISQLRELNRGHRKFIDDSMQKIAEVVRRECLRAARQGHQRVELDAKELAAEIKQRDVTDNDLRQFAARLESDDEFKHIQVTAQLIKPPDVRKKISKGVRRLVLTWS